MPRTRIIKTRRVDLVGNDETFQTNTGLEVEEQEGKGIRCLCVKKYDFVCVYYRDPDHPHRSDYRKCNNGSEDSNNEESSSPTVEELSDSEDSPFLPPLNNLQ